MTAVATQFSVWTNRAQPNFGSGARHADFPFSNADGRIPLPVYQPITARSRTWQNLLGFQSDTVTIPAQEFDSTLPEATFAALAPTFLGEATFDPTVTVATFAALAPTFFSEAFLDTGLPVATFAALAPTFFSEAFLDTGLPVATFAALAPTFFSEAFLDTGLPVATFAALAPTFFSEAFLDTSLPQATFTALDVTIDVSSTGDFNPLAPTATFTALNVTFSQPSPTPPAPVPRFRRGGGGGVYWQLKREQVEKEECETKETPEERLECIIEKLEKIVDKDPKQNQKRFLTGAAGMLLTILIKRSND